MDADLQTQLTQMSKMLTQLISSVATLRTQLSDIQQQMVYQQEDVAQLRIELYGIRDELRAEMQGIRDELRAEMQGIRDELRAEMQGHYDTLRQQHKTLADHSSAQLEMQTNLFQALQKEIRSGWQELLTVNHQLAIRVNYLEKCTDNLVAAAS